ncbi:MAG: phosphate acyltransferase PlsX [Abyssibacter sp.]|uniref:phosphate acyltransferase PlsX n=1 Tax=Abyssibacter sp. TaxID=2320200 RepID=UPI00321A3034
MTDLRIALDAMSGDHGAAVVLLAASRVLAERSDLSLLIVGDTSQIGADVATLAGRYPGRVELLHADEVVGMDELPSRALRGKKRSSMRLAINAVKNGQAHACVSAGNTGALMATARFVLKTLPHIDRPAIISRIPSLNGYTLMLDLGANVECTADHLVQFAAMGDVVAHAVHGQASPRVALLNIGEEEIKGNDAIREAGQRLADSDLNYIGYVEGTDVFLGDVDVVVCDGFSGNVALKSSEGVAKLIGTLLREEFSRNALTKLSALAARPVLKSFARRIDPGNYNGASFVGLQGTVIKSHGSADENAFANAIRIALVETDYDVPRKIESLLVSSLGAVARPESAPQQAAS